MRTYTLAFSILVHILVIGGFIMVPIVANGDLPELRRAVEFIEVAPPPAPTVPPPRPLGSTRAQRVNPLAAPVEAPDSITPETPFEPLFANVLQGFADAEWTEPHTVGGHVSLAALARDPSAPSGQHEPRRPAGAS